MCCAVTVKRVADRRRRCSHVRRAQSFRSRSPPSSSRGPRLGASSAATYRLPVAVHCRCRQRSPGGQSPAAAARGQSQAQSRRPQAQLRQRPCVRPVPRLPRPAVRFRSCVRNYQRAGRLRTNTAARDGDRTAFSNAAFSGRGGASVALQAQAQAKVNVSEFMPKRVACQRPGAGAGRRRHAARLEREGQTKDSFCNGPVRILVRVRPQAALFGMFSSSMLTSCVLARDELSYGCRSIAKEGVGSA